MSEKLSYQPFDWLILYWTLAREACAPTAGVKFANMAANGYMVFKVFYPLLLSFLHKIIFVLKLVKCLKLGIKNRNSVLKWVGKSAIFVLNRVRVWGAAPHLPNQGYIEYPPPPGYALTNHEVIYLWNTKWAFARKHDLFTREGNIFTPEKITVALVIYKNCAFWCLSWHDLVFHWCLHNK